MPPPPLPPTEPNLRPGHRCKPLPARFWTCALSLPGLEPQPGPASEFSVCTRRHQLPWAGGGGKRRQFPGRWLGCGYHTAPLGIHPIPLSAAPKCLQGGTRGEAVCPPALCWGFTPTCVQGSRGRGDPLRSWQEGDDSAGQDEAQLVLGWGGGYKRGREGRTWALGLGKGLEQSPGGVCLLLKLLAEH